MKKKNIGICMHSYEMFHYTSDAILFDYLMDLLYKVKYQWDCRLNYFSINC